MIKGCVFTKKSLNEILEALEFAHKIHLMFLLAAYIWRAGTEHFHIGGTQHYGSESSVPISIFSWEIYSLN